MAKDVRVKINLAKSTTSSGFGYPLIFEGKATTAIEYTECSSIDDVIRVVGGITDADAASAIETKTATAKATNIYKAALLLLMQDNAPSTIAVCATTGSATTGLAGILHEGWRQLIVVSSDTEGEDTRKAISDYIETTGKMYFTSVADVASATISGNDRTVVMVHEDDVAFPEAALVGATAGKPAGSLTYKNQMLKGLTPKVLPEAELTAIHNANAMAFVLKSGDGVTSEGMTTGGEYIDVIDSQDFIIQGIENNVQKTLNRADKVPYDNVGIAMLEISTASVLKAAAENGMIAVTDSGVYDYSVSFLPRSATKASDRAARRYPEGRFHFALAGAIHEADINGTIEI
jgi:hypothetical protein